MIVENQIALGEPPLVAATIARLMDEGLSRDAVHAVGSVVFGAVFEVLKNPNDSADPNARSNRELAALTAASWRAQAEPET